MLIKASFESKIPGQSGKLDGTPASRPKNGTVPVKTGRLATPRKYNQSIQLFSLAVTTSFVYLYWDFRDALRRKSLCFFRHILRIRIQK